MRILHAADLHLAPRLDYIRDRARRGARREDFARQADRLPELVREHGAELVLLAGDVFDRDLPALPEAGRLAAALAACEVPVLVVPGTHDPWRPGGVWDRGWPANVTVFSEDRWMPARAGECAVYGLACRGRPLGRPLFAGLPAPDPGARFHVGLVHASLLWADVKAKVDAKNFPFEEAELDGLSLDYLALGDHHRTRSVRRARLLAAYPGSPEGLAFDPAEAGDRHLLLVELGDEGAAVTPLRTNAREIHLEEIDLAALEGDSPGDLAESVRRRLAAAARPDRLARFDLTGVLAEPHPLELPGLELGSREGYFLLELRDRTRTLPKASGGEASTIRAAFERRLRDRLEAAAEAGERETVELALRFGLQALENLL
jgi:DNA repair exonuclease SbcCD nuclease subunit